MTEKEGILRSQLKGLEEVRTRREKDLRESHLNESWWWKLRCAEKNELIQILARRIAHLSATDVHSGSILEGVLREISKVGGSYGVPPADGEDFPMDTGSVDGQDFPLDTGSVDGQDFPMDTGSLFNYFQTERRWIMVML